MRVTERDTRAICPNHPKGATHVLSSPRRLTPAKLSTSLRTSGLVDLSVPPLERVVDQVSQLDDVAGYVLAWERYVLVVANQAAEPDDSTAGN